MNPKHEILNWSLAFFSGDVAAKDFQLWLEENYGRFDDAEIEFALPLIEKTLESKTDIFDFSELFKKQYVPIFGANLQKDTAKYLLEQIIQNKGDLVAYCHRLAKLIVEKVDFLPIEFMGYSSELDDIPLLRDSSKWDEASFREKRKKLETYSKAICELASKTLSLVK